MIDTATFWIITVVFIAITLGLGYLGWKKTKSGEDFLLAGRKVNPIIIGLSYGATFISTSAIVGFGGYAGTYGMGLIWLTMLNILVGVVIAFTVFGKRTHKLSRQLKAVTFPHLIGKIFNSSSLHYGVATIILVGMPLYVSAVMIGGSRFIEETLEVDFSLALICFALVTMVYVVFGGLRAVMYTDAMQGAVMVFGMSILLVLTYSLLGGITEANADLTALASQVPQSLADQGMTGWTSMPELGSPLWLTMVTTIFLGVGIGVLAEPQLAIRFMTAKDTKALNRAIPIGAFFILMTAGVAYTVGPLTNVYFMKEYGQISYIAAGQNFDKIIPMYINATMPDLFIAIFMVVLLAAAMSTSSSVFHTMGTAAGYDIWSNFKQSKYYKGTNRSPKPSITANRVGISIMMLISVLLAFTMPTNIIARATAMWFGLAACAILPMYCHGLFSKRLSIKAAKASMIVGAVSWFVWTSLFHKAESSVLGISNLFTGQGALLGLPWSNIDPLIIALPLAFATLGVTWYLDRNNLVMKAETTGSDVEATA